MKTIEKKLLSVLLICALVLTSMLNGVCITTSTIKAADEEEHVFIIHTKRPYSATSGSAIVGSGFPNIFAYYKTATGYKDLTQWPGVTMYYGEEDDKGVWYNVKISAPSNILYVCFLGGVTEITTTAEPTGEVVSTTYEPSFVFPTVEDISDHHFGFQISSAEVWYDPLTMNSPSTTKPARAPYPGETATPAPTAVPTATPTAVPTATPTEEPVALPDTESVAGPQVAVSVPNGSSYYQEHRDSLPLTIQLAGGATSADVSIDNGPVTTITKETEFKVGTGKFANSMVTVTVTSTNGTITNTQHFYYYKRTYEAKPSQVGMSTKSSDKIHLSTMMLHLTSVVKLAETKKTFTVSYTIPDESKLAEAKKVWTAKDAHVYAYAYHIDETTKSAVKPLGDWPGTPMNKLSDSKYGLSFSAAYDSVNVIFVCVKGELGKLVTPANEEAHYECTVSTQLPEKNGFEIKTNTDFAADGTATEVQPSAVVSSSTPTPTSTAVMSTATAIVVPTNTTAVTLVPSSTTPATATIVPTATPDNSTPAPFAGYFGANLAAPQYAGTQLNISAKTFHAKGIVNYTYAVNGEVIHNSADATCIWNTAGLKAGNYVLQTVITDTMPDGTFETIVKEKTYPITEKTVEGLVITPEPYIETPAPTTAAPTMVPTEAPTIEPTATQAVMTEEPTMEPTATPLPVSNTISFSKASGKGTCGESIKISTSLVNEIDDEAYTYTFKVTQNNTVKTIAKKSEDPFTSWKLAKEGTCKVTVICYDWSGKQVCSSTVSYKIGKKVITLKSLTPSSCKKKKKTTFTCKATATTGKLSYKFEVRDSGQKLVTKRGYSKSNKFTWTPKKKDTYTVTIYLKTDKGVQIKASKTVKVK